MVRLSIANFSVVDINVLLQITEDLWEMNHIVSNLEQYLQDWWYLIADLWGLERKSYQNLFKWFVRITATQSTIQLDIFGKGKGWEFEHASPPPQILLSFPFERLPHRLGETTRWKHFWRHIGLSRQLIEPQSKGKLFVGWYWLSWLLQSSQRIKA